MALRLTVFVIDSTVKSRHVKTARSDLVSCNGVETEDEAESGSHVVKKLKTEENLKYF